jgi:hypothetical protein
MHNRQVIHDKVGGVTTIPEPVTFDLRRLLDEHRPDSHRLFAEHVNPRFASVLRTIGFDRFFVRAEGQYLWDAQGHRYLDFLGGYAVCNVGRNHPTVKQALHDCLDMDLPSMVQFDAPPLAGMLARELTRRIGRGLDRVYFTNSGTEGVEAAIKFSRTATGRPGILFAERAFHGLTTGALSLNGCQSFRQGFGPFLPETRMVRFGDLADLEGALRAGDILHPLATLPKPVTSVTSTARSLLPTRCRLASAEPVNSWQSIMTNGANRTWWCSPKHCQAGWFRWVR